MTSLQKDLSELRSMVINGQNNEIKNKIKEQINIYNIFNNMLNQYKLEMNSIIMEYNKKTQSKNVIKCINDNNQYNFIYDKNNNAYSININGIIIKGNLGKIYNINDKNIINTVVCNNSSCKRNKCIHNILNRNYFNNSWTYNPSSKYARKIGGRDTLIEDLNRLSLQEKKYEYDLRSSQLIHDIIILTKLVNDIDEYH